MDIKQKITELTEAYPELLGFRGKLAYMLCEAIPENADLTDKTTLDLMAWIPEEHLEHIYKRLTDDGYVITPEGVPTPEFKDTFKRLRKQMGMTQLQFANFYGMSRRNIENWETGTTEPPVWSAKLLLADMEKYIEKQKGTE